MAEKEEAKETMHDRRHKMIMQKLKESISLRFAAVNHALPLKTPYPPTFIDCRLHQLFNSFHTPTHPPYAMMIRRAIKELNDENGSNKDAISDFIRREYDDLPWSHATVLDIHLRNLCSDGDISCNENQRYALSVECDDNDDVTQDREIQEQGPVVSEATDNNRDSTEEENRQSNSNQSVDEKNRESERLLQGDEVELDQQSWSQ